MRNLFCAGALVALATLASCGGDPSSAPSSSTRSAASTAAQPQQAIRLTTASTGLARQVTPKGVKVQLDGHFQNAVLARRNADGTLSTECDDEQQQADAFMQGATATRSEVK